MAEGEVTPKEFGELKGVVSEMKKDVKDMKNNQDKFFKEMRRTIMDTQKYTDKQIAASVKACEYKKNFNSFQGDVIENMEKINLVLFGSREKRLKGLVEIVEEISPLGIYLKKFTKFSVFFTIIFFGGVGLVTYNVLKPIYDAYIVNHK